MALDRLSPDKNRLGFALTRDAQDLLKGLKAKLGVSQNGVVELAIRRLAQAEGVSLAETGYPAPSDPVERA